MLIFQEDQIEKNFGLAKPGIYYLQVHFDLPIGLTLFKFEIRGRRDSLDRDGRFSLVQHLFFLLYLYLIFCSPASSSRSAIERCRFHWSLIFLFLGPTLLYLLSPYFHFF